jgi:alkane 1-monooxygenase
VPWLWFRVMDQRLLGLEHIKGDLTKINIDPDKHDAIYQKYGPAENPDGTGTNQE